MFLTALSGNRQLYVCNQKAEWSRLNEIHVQFSEKGAINEKPE